ncbi:hypothetical protein JTB14_025169 [Gonioctena quinquepunctata]|nr:hypothetical protein JTB14_025169 [Gonioctena quinquepunctata]
MFLQPDKYKNVGTQIVSRFGEEANSKIPVTTISIPQLGEILDLSRDENFSLFIPKHRRIAGRLIDIFLVCSDVSKIQLAAISNLPGGMWACPECRRPTGTRTRSHSAVDQGMIMVQADGTADDDVSGVAGNGATSTKISSNEFLKSLKSEIQMLRESVDFCSNMVTDFDEKLLKMNEYFKITEKLKMENASMRNDVLELKKQIDNLEYSTRSNNIEIHEVPEKNNENLVDVVTKIGRFLNISLDPDSIDTAFRVPSRAENKPKNIVVKFKFKQSRDYFLTAA